MLVFSHTKRLVHDKLTTSKMH